MEKEKMTKGKVTFLHIFNRDGTIQDAIEIVDTGNKKSLGIFEITNHAQYFVRDPLDMPEVENIYKDSFDVFINSK